MSGAAFRIVSPSSSSRRRSTPWVDGCCGPMLSTMVRVPVCSFSWSSWSRWTSSSEWIPVSIAIFPLVARARHRVVFPQRIAFPVFGKHDPPQVWMVPEANAEQVERLALIPVSRPVDGNRGFDFRIRAGNACLQPEAALVRHGLQVINDFKARLGGISIDAGNRSEPFEFVILFQTPESVQDVFRRDLDGLLAERVLDIDSYVFQHGR